MQYQQCLHLQILKQCTNRGLPMSCRLSLSAMECSKQHASVSHGVEICYCWFQETINVKQKNKKLIRFVFVFASVDGEAVPAYPFPSMSTLPEMDWPNICSPGLTLRPDSFWNKWWQLLNNNIWTNILKETVLHMFSVVFSEVGLTH